MSKPAPFTIEILSSALWKKMIELANIARSQSSSSSATAAASASTSVNFGHIGDIREVEAQFENALKAIENLIIERGKTLAEVRPALAAYVAEQCKGQVVTVADDMSSGTINPSNIAATRSWAPTYSPAAATPASAAPAKPIIYSSMNDADYDDDSRNPNFIEAINRRGTWIEITEASKGLLVSWQDRYSASKKKNNLDDQRLVNVQAQIETLKQKAHKSGAVNLHKPNDSNNDNSKCCP